MYKSFRLLNLTDDGLTVKFNKRGNSVTFPDGNPTTLAENERDVGFCISPLPDLSEFTSDMSSCSISSFPIGVSGVVVYDIGAGQQQVRYAFSRETISERISWLMANVPGIDISFDNVSFNIVSRDHDLNLRIIDADIDFEAQGFEVVNGYGNVGSYFIDMQILKSEEVTINLAPRASYGDLHLNAVRNLRIGGRDGDVVIVLNSGEIRKTIVPGEITPAKFYTNIGLGEDGSGMAPWGDVTDIDHVEFKSTITAITGDFTGKMTNLRTLTFNNVGPIGEGAFKGISAMDSITIGPTVTSIGKNAFMGASTNALIFSEGVQSIGDYAFANIKNASELIVPESVSELGEGAFAQWGSPKKLTVGGVNLPEIQGHEFADWGAKGATDLTLREGVEMVSTYNSHAFAGWKGTALELPDTLTFAGDNAFANWTKSTKLIIGDGELVTRTSVFEGWTAARELVFGGLVEAGNAAFKGWSTYSKALTIPNTVVRILGESFQNWEYCPALTISEGVTTVAYTHDESYDKGMNAFSGWVSATSLRLPDTLTSTNHSFHGWHKCTNLHIGSGLKSIGSGVNTEDHGEFGEMAMYSYMPELIIPDTVELLDGFALAQIGKVTIGKGVKSILGMAASPITMIVLPAVPPTLLPYYILPAYNVGSSGEVYVTSISTYKADGAWNARYGNSGNDRFKTITA